MHRRSAARWRMGAILLLWMLFALGSFWLVQVVSRGEFDVLGAASTTEPDYFVERFSFVRMTPGGQPRYIISGDKLTHRPSDDTLDVVLPVVHTLVPGKPPMTMHAKTAHIDQASNVVDLSGNVDIRRPRLGATEAMTLNTEALTVYTDEDRMQTAQPFQLMIGATSVAGVGMKANNATGQLDVQSKMELTFPPRARQAEPARKTRENE